MENNSLWKRTVRIAIAVIALAGCSKNSDENKQTPAASANGVTLTPAQRQNIHLFTVAQAKFHKTIDTTGSVDFDNDQATSVLAPFSGPVSKLLVSLGQTVKKGDALAIVDSPDFATAIGTYRKAIATAKTARQVADTDKDLAQHNGISQRDEQQAQTDAANAEADREAALQALVSLNVDQKIIKDIQEGRVVSRIDGTIRAPIAGTVVEKLISPGQLLQAGTTPVFTVADLSRVWVTAQVFGSNLAQINVGDQSDVSTDFDSKMLSGKVDNISALVDPTTRAVGVRVVVDNPNGLLKKQMYVRVLIHSNQESSGLLVPVSAVLRDDENLPFVYVAQPNGNFARAHVTLGYRDGDRYEITDGLHAGDQVIVDGGLFVQFMQSQ
jgi:cobalt-zinc-cadmium efflux system membrane fusion protein